jgi:RNA polymerase sigma factor (sigma-70 family)
MLAPPSQLSPAHLLTEKTGPNGDDLADKHLSTQAPALSQDQRDQLVQAYRPLVRSTVRKDFGGFYDLREDLEQAGYVGLVKACAKFDPGRGSFGVYARFWIKREVCRELRRSQGVPRRKGKPLARVAFDDRNVKELAEPAADTTEPEIASLRIRYDQVAKGVLSLREARIVNDRHLVHKPKTLQQIGAAHGISTERVRQIEARALAKLKVAAAAVSRGEAPRRRLDDDAAQFLDEYCHVLIKGFGYLTRTRDVSGRCQPTLLYRHRQGGASLLFSQGLPGWSGKPRADKPTVREINVRAAYYRTYGPRLRSWELGAQR